MGKVKVQILLRRIKQNETFPPAPRGMWWCIIQDKEGKILAEGQGFTLEEARNRAV